MKTIGFEDFIRRYYSGEGFVLFDTETTGLNTFHDDIIEVAGMTWQLGEEPRAFQKIMNVNINKISEAAWEIHQIPKDEIEAAPPADLVLREFVDFCDGRTLLAHNIRFDYEMLNSNLIRNGLVPYSNDQVACTLVYAKEQGMPGKLSDLARHYKVQVKDSQLHRALYDVQMLMEVVNLMVKEHEPQEMQYSLIF